MAKDCYRPSALGYVAAIRPSGVRDAVDADLGVFPRNLPRPARYQGHVAPLIELRDERRVAIAPEVFAVDDDVAHTMRFDRVDRRLIRKIIDGAGQAIVRRREEPTVTVDQVLPVKRRIVEIRRVGGSERGKLE